MINVNLDGVQDANEYKSVTPGGYICLITDVSDMSEKQLLKLEYDIADGEFKNYYKNLYDTKGFWGATFVKSYKPKALPFFKALITSVEKSNPGYKWDNDEVKLIGKFVGLVLGEEEYTNNNGEIKKRLYVDQVHSVATIKAGKYKVPEFKSLNGNKAEFAPPDDLPFL